MKNKQLTFTTIGGEIVSVHQRGKHYVQPRGYAHHPGTGPAGETCKSCEFCVKFRRWYKCELAHHRWTGGRASDILAKAPACMYWKRARVLKHTIMTEKEFLTFISSVKNVG